MKPRTKEQKEVWALYNRPGYLRNNRMTPAFIEWVKKTYRIEEAYACAGKAWCSECAREFDLPKGATEAVCPHCGKKLKVVKSRRQHEVRDAIYLQELTTCGRWQVIKTYHLEVRSDKGYTVGITHYIHKCYEKWINEEGKFVVIARPIKCMPTYARIPWSRSFLVNDETGVEIDQWRQTERKEIEFSVKIGTGQYYNGWDIKNVYPIAKIQPWLKKYGLTKDTHGFDFGDLATKLPNGPAETYWKQGQYNLVGLFLYTNEWDLRLCAPAVKVARRHGYDFEQVNMREYRDHIRLLDELGWDIHNPDNVAPADLAAAHQRAIDESNRRAEREERRREELARMTKAERDKAAQAKYVKDKAKFLNLTFADKGLTFHVLQSIKEFYQIGKDMHICVYSCAYYEKAGSLIMCATDQDGKRVEIIEVDLNRWRIVQSRAVCNGASDRHADIISIVNRNMGLIKQTARASA